MTALSAAKKIIKMDGPNFVGPLLVKASAIIYNGAMVSLSGGYAKQAEGADDVVLGVARLDVYDSINVQGISFQQAGLPGTSGSKIDATGKNNGDLQVLVEVGVFKMTGKTGDAPAQTDIGSDCFVEDDTTVKMTAAGAIAAGKVIRIDDDGHPFVQVGVAGAFGNI